MSKTKATKQESPVASFEEACQRKGIDPEKVFENALPNYPEHLRAALIETGKMFIVAEELNRLPDGTIWEPDWNDRNQYKYYPWFDMEVDENTPSGFRFFVSCYDWTYSSSNGGSRLCYRSEEISDYAGKTFEASYKIMMVIPKK